MLREDSGMEAAKCQNRYTWHSAVPVLLSTFRSLFVPKPILLFGDTNENQHGGYRNSSALMSWRLSSLFKP